MSYAIKILGNGNIEQISKRWDVHELQSAIGGGWLQAIPLRDGGVMWMDEEGKLKNQPVNPVATMVALKAAAIFADDTINGIALVTGLEDDHGIIGPVPPAVVNAIEDAREQVGGS